MQAIDHLRLKVTSGLSQAGRQWRRIVAKDLEELGVSDACAAPLVWTARLGEGARQNTLASYVGIEGPTLVRLLDQLSGSGLITRCEDPNDRRAKTIWLTAKGKDITAKIEASLTLLRERVLSDISAEDLAGALRVLEAVERASHAISAEREAAQ